MVPLSHYITDSDFCRYITRSNDTIGDNQLYNLRKLKHYVRNPGLSVTNQNVSSLFSGDSSEICGVLICLWPLNLSWLFADSYF